MEHGPAGAAWGPGGVSVRCQCGWLSDPPTKIGPGWIEELEARMEAHLAEAP